MLLTNPNLQTLRQQFAGAFRNGFAGAKPEWNRIATKVPSSTKENVYAWLGQFPGVREWLGDRVIKSMEQHDYAIKNRKFETTVDVPVDSIEDDQYGVFDPIMQAMGEAVGMHPDELIFELLLAGFATVCYDGQYFFDTDHPVNGESVSNYQAGGGEPWFVLDVSRPLKPLIYQERKPFTFFDFTGANDAMVRMKGKAIYGSDGRDAAGYGFWQMAYASKATLNEANLDTALKYFANQKGDHGQKLNTQGNLLVCGFGNRLAARKLLVAEYGSSGESNVNKDTLQLMVSSRITT